MWLAIAPTSRAIEGMLLEEAETKAGGPEKLQGMIDRGAVQVSMNSAGHDMYYFPRATFGERQSFSDRLKVQKNKQVDGSVYEKLNNCFHELNWGIQCKQTALEACECM